MNHNLAQNIVYYRKTMKKLTQDELAELMNVSRQAVAKWENGESEPDLSKLIKLSTIFGISVDRLLFQNHYDNVPSCRSNHHDKNIIEIEGFNITSLMEIFLKIDPLDSILYTYYPNGLICEETNFLYGTNPSLNHESLKNCILELNGGRKRTQPFNLLIETTLPPSQMKDFIHWISQNIDALMIDKVFLIYETNADYNFKCRDLDLIYYLEKVYTKPWEQLRKSFIIENNTENFPIPDYYSQLKNTKHEFNMPYWFIMGFH